MSYQPDDQGGILKKKKNLWSYWFNTHYKGVHGQSQASLT